MRTQTPVALLLNLRRSSHPEHAIQAVSGLTLTREGQARPTNSSYVSSINPFDPPFSGPPPPPPPTMRVHQIPPKAPYFNMATHAVIPISCIPLVGGLSGLTATSLREATMGSCAQPNFATSACVLPSLLYLPSDQTFDRS